MELEPRWQQRPAENSAQVAAKSQRPQDGL
jgi:hypothetical protein